MVEKAAVARAAVRVVETVAAEMEEVVTGEAQVGALMEVLTVVSLVGSQAERKVVSTAVWMAALMGVVRVARPEELMGVTRVEQRVA